MCATFLKIRKCVYLGSRDRKKNRWKERGGAALYYKILLFFSYTHKHVFIYFSSFFWRSVLKMSSRKKQRSCPRFDIIISFYCYYFEQRIHRAFTSLITFDGNEWKPKSDFISIHPNAHSESRYFPMNIWTHSSNWHSSWQLLQTQ